VLAIEHRFFSASPVIARRCTDKVHGENRTMNATTKTLLTKLLPILALPAILLTSLTAEAASLDISNGVITTRTLIAPNVYAFAVYGSGVITHEGQSVPSTIELDCELDSANDLLDCVGELKINGVARNIYMGSEDDTIWWTIVANAGALFINIHELWGQTVVPEVQPGATEHQMWWPIIAETLDPIYLAD
jgi:hypothetical protein